MLSFWFFVEIFLGMTEGMLLFSMSSNFQSALRLGVETKFLHHHHDSFKVLTKRGYSLIFCSRREETAMKALLSRRTLGA